MVHGNGRNTPPLGIPERPLTAPDRYAVSAAVPPDLPLTRQITAILRKPVPVQPRMPEQRPQRHEAARVTSAVAVAPQPVPVFAPPAAPAPIALTLVPPPLPVAASIPSEGGFRTWPFVLAAPLLAAGVATAMLLPGFSGQSYVAQTRIGAGLDSLTTASTGRAAPLSADRLALLKAEAKGVTARAVLARTVEDLKLDRDPEFAAGKPSSLGVLSDLLSGNGDLETDPQRIVENNLQKAVTTTLDPATRAVAVSVASRDAQKAARIANRLAENYVATTTGAGTADPAAAGDKAALQASGRALEQAQSEFDRFVTDTGADKIAAASEIGTALDALVADIAAARLRLSDEAGKMKVVKAITLAEVLGGSLSPDLAAYALEDLRAKYVAANVSVDQLSVALGPRHPQLAAARSVADALKADIRKELGRLLSVRQQALQQAQKDERTLVQKQTELQKKLDAIGFDRDRLQALESQLDQARLRHDTLLDRMQNAAPVTAQEPSRILGRAVAGTPASAVGSLFSRAAVSVILFLLAALLILVGLFGPGRRRTTAAAFAAEAVIQTPAAAAQPHGLEPPHPTVADDTVAMPRRVAATRELPQSRPRWPDQDAFHSANDDIAPVAVARPAPGNSLRPRPDPLLEQLRRVAPSLLQDVPAKDDVLQLRGDMVALRERLQSWSERRSATRR